MRENNQYPRVSVEVLERFMNDVLTKVGVPPEDAATVADVLITADKFGIDSHGISRLKPIYYNRIKDGILNPVTKIDIVREGPPRQCWTATTAWGTLSANRPWKWLSIKLGNMVWVWWQCAIPATTGSPVTTPTGRRCRQSESVEPTPVLPSRPTFGVEPMLGTNPLTFSMPTDEEFHFFLDCATSMAQRGKIEVYARLDKDIPEGWVIDNEGRIRTDTHGVLADLPKGTAALTPLGESWKKRAATRVTAMQRLWDPVCCPPGRRAFCTLSPA